MYIYIYICIWFGTWWLGDNRSIDFDYAPWIKSWSKSYSLHMSTLFHGFAIQVRSLNRARCTGRTAREILQTEKLDRVLRPNKRQRYGKGQMRPPQLVTESLSLMHLFPRELLDWSFESLEQESQLVGQRGDRARKAVNLILSSRFDKPRWLPGIQHSQGLTAEIWKWKLETCTRSQEAVKATSCDRSLIRFLLKRKLEDIRTPRDNGWNRRPELHFSSHEMANGWRTKVSVVRWVYGREVWGTWVPWRQNFCRYHKVFIQLGSLKNLKNVTSISEVYFQNSSVFLRHPLISNAGGGLCHRPQSACRGAVRSMLDGMQFGADSSRSSLVAFSVSWCWFFVHLVGVPIDTCRH